MSNLQIDLKRYRRGVYQLYTSKAHDIKIMPNKKLVVYFARHLYLDKIKLLMRLERECPNLCDIRKTVRNDKEYVLYVFAKLGAYLSVYDMTCTLSRDDNAELFEQTTKLMLDIDLLLEAKRTGVMKCRNYRKAIRDLIDKPEVL